VWTRAPLRLRLTVVFGAAMALVLVGLGTFTYLRLGAELLDSVDLGLRPRAQTLQNAVAIAPASSVGSPSGSLIDPDEAFAQVLGSGGEILDASSGVSARPLLGPGRIRALTGPTFISQPAPGFDDPVRLLAVPVDRADGRVVLIVGSTLGDLNDALQRLLAGLVTAGPVALVLTMGLAWLLAGAALRPVELLRAEAAAITASEPARRLAVPRTGDELARLGLTLNAMLGRLQEAIEREHRFVDEASHELRTPLATLRTEIDLALARQHSNEELEAALRSASDDVERLQRLADDFLVLSRARAGRVPIRRVPAALADVVTRSLASVAAHAASAGVRTEYSGPDSTVELDPQRVEQALRNLLENAIRYSPRGGVVRVAADRHGNVIRIAVQDSGPGFAQEMLSDGFDPFARLSGNPSGTGAGLGLTIVRAVAEAHGGSAWAENGDKGARVTMELPA